MTCNWLEKVSMMVDGELPPDEQGAVSDHLRECVVCRQAHTDFLALQREIAAYEVEVDPAAKKRALDNILSAPGSVPFWKRQIALPAPVLAFACMVVLALAAWTVIQQVTRRPPDTPSSKGGGAPILPATPDHGFDLSKFDQGRRAEIFTTRKPSSGAGNGGGL